MHRGQARLLGGLGKGSHHILVERLAVGTGFLAAVEHGDRIVDASDRVARIMLRPTARLSDVRRSGVSQAMRAVVMSSGA